MRLSSLLLRHRRPLLMQFGPSAPSKSLASRISPPSKRSASQAAATRLDEARGPKQARLDSLAPTSANGQLTSSTSSIPVGSDSTMQSVRSSVRSKNSSRTGRGARGRSAHPSRGGGGSSSSKAKGPSLPVLSEPLQDEEYHKGRYPGLIETEGGLPSDWKKNPKSALANFMTNRVGHAPNYEKENGILNGKKITRVRVSVVDDIVGVGDAVSAKEAEKIAALSACYDIISRGLAKKENMTGTLDAQDSVLLSDGTSVTYEMARQFMDYYCRKFRFGQPFLDFEEVKKGKFVQSWEAIMTVGGRRIGIGAAKSKKDAQKNCYLDVVQYLEKCDPKLWQMFVEAAKTGKDLGLAPKVFFQMSDGLGDEIGDLNWSMKRSELYNNRPELKSFQTAEGEKESSTQSAASSAPRRWRYTKEVLDARSAELMERRKKYLQDPKHEKMRATRQSLPVYTKAEDVLKHIDENEITILMAATGSGKTTQIPQLILDHWIDKNEGGKCNVFCTQPRRLAAISVAHRVASERGEVVGKNSSIGYQVRFEAKLPEENGSVTFCTIGIFLRRMQSALQRGYDKILDNVTHVIVDEVHERDIDTDLLLVVIKRLLEDRKAKGNPLKVILMSATIDPTLFQRYFPDAAGNLAPVIEIPGRSFPVKKHFLDNFLPAMIQEHKQSNWVFNDDKVLKYITRELPNASNLLPSHSRFHGAIQRNDGKEREQDLEIPYPLVALTIAHVLKNSNSGHVLVFLPGWDEIQAVQRIIQDPQMRLPLDLKDRSKFSLHVLHSTIPLAEQQIIFDPPPAGIRRIILSTNIAETSVTIPDVVYVVDTARIKENRYDPERHISSLVSAWVGTSNLNQRAGRAGRHRPGEYYGILGHDRASKLHSHQTVEMKRMDLSNVVMHVKALDFPNMEVEDVLAATIEPPEAERVASAINNLKMVGALDESKNLTSLGRVLLQLPVEVQMGRLVLYGSLFKCLDGALTLAAILTNRDPFLTPPLLKKEAQAVKDSWCPDEFRSDALAVLNAFNAWNEFEKRGDHAGGSRFCSDNFLSKNTLLTISKIRTHLLQSLYDVGVIGVSAGGTANTSTREPTVPPQLNENGRSLPMLAALIAIASQPKFAIRTSSMTYRTAQDKTTAIHPASVNHRKRVGGDDESTFTEKQIFAFSEKRQNLSVIGQAPGQMYLVGCTRLDPMTYVLFGAYNLVASDNGLECDEWLPIVGNSETLDDIRRLKALMEGCMLRVFEGININMKSQRAHPTPGRYIPPFARSARDNHEDESGDEDDQSAKDQPLSSTEIKQLDQFTSGIVRILDRYAEERHVPQSRRNSRPATPTLTPLMASRGLPPIGGGGGWRSGTSTPRYGSRPGTPSRLSSWGHP